MARDRGAAHVTPLCMLRLALALTVLVFSGCDEDDTGPNSPHCVEVRMRWLEADYQRRMAQNAGDYDLALSRAHLQDLIVNRDVPCFPGFALR